MFDNENKLISKEVVRWWRPRQFWKAGPFLDFDRPFPVAGQVAENRDWPGKTGTSGHPITMWPLKWHGQGHGIQIYSIAL